MNIAVIALGKIGLPLAVQFAAKGNRVVGVDTNPTTVEAVNNSREPFPGEKDLAALLTSVVADGRLSATTDTQAAVRASDFVVVVVPVFVDGQGIPDFASIDDATRAIGQALRPGTVVSYETTLPVGTTRNRFAPLIEDGSGLRVGADFSVVFSPERVFTGRVFEDLRRYPKLVGGLDTRSGDLGTQFYERVLEFDDRADLARPNGVWNLGSAEAAELAKLAETTYRDVNIGLANQFARFADANSIDIYSVIEACNSQPFSHIHQPGIAVGGHCIPIYPRMYLLGDPDASVVRAAREANLEMPAYAAARLEETHGSLTGESVVVLGATYRGGVKETAFSGVFPLVAALESRGATVFVHDPMLTSDEIRDLGFTPYSPGSPADAAVVQADHTEYSALKGSDIPDVRTVLDGRRILDPNRWSGIDLVQLGSPDQS